MLKSIKITIAVVLCLCLCLLPALAGTAFLAAENAQSAKKVISVVFDDSGSMTDDGVDRMGYANYAMQSLVALLNPQDELYLTYMSDENTARSVNLGDVEGEVAAVRSWSGQGGTPYNSVSTAVQAIQGVDGDAATQYWLMVFTDGQMEGVTDENPTMHWMEKPEMQKEFDKLKQTDMANGTKLNVAYIALGKVEKDSDGNDTVYVLNGDTANGLYTFHAEDGVSIRDTLNQVAGLISGRMDAENVSQKSGNTVSFSSKLPMYSVSVLSHNTDATVTAAKGSEADLLVEKQIKLDTTDSPRVTTKLIGNAATLRNADSGVITKAIPKGDYEVTFSKDVNISDVLIQYEPAIGMKMTVAKEGVVVKDTGTLQIGDKVDIEITPVVAGTNEEIPESNLPSGTEWKVEYRVDDVTKKEESGKKLSGVELLEGDNKVVGTMSMPGFAPLVVEMDFNINVRVYDLGIEVIQPDDLTYERGKLGEIDENNAIVFRLTDGGKPLSKEELEAGGISLTVDDITVDDSTAGAAGFLAFQNAKMTLRQNDDGTFTLVPSMPVPLMPYIIKGGDYTVTVKTTGNDDPATATGTLRVVPSLADWLFLFLLLLALALIVYLIFIFFIKYKFDGRLVHYDVYKLKVDGSGTLMRASSSSIELKRFGCHLFAPTRACYVVYKGLKIKAGPDGTAYITGKSIAEKTYSYRQSKANPERNLNALIKQLRRTRDKNGEFIASDTELSNTPVYFRSSENDKMIWSLK